MWHWDTMLGGNFGVDEGWSGSTRIITCGGKSFQHRAATTYALFTVSNKLEAVVVCNWACGRFSLADVYRIGSQLGGREASGMTDQFLGWQRP